eukprot:366573-Chlamydomonas_euryale.AAC.35
MDQARFKTRLVCNRGACASSCINQLVHVKTTIQKVVFVSGTAFCATPKATARDLTAAAALKLRQSLVDSNDFQTRMVYDIQDGKQHQQECGEGGREGGREVPRRRGMYERVRNWTDTCTRSHACRGAHIDRHMHAQPCVQGCTHRQTHARAAMPAGVHT